MACWYADGHHVIPAAGGERNPIRIAVHPGDEPWRHTEQHAEVAAIVDLNRGARWIEGVVNDDVGKTRIVVDLDAAENRRRATFDRRS